MVGTWNWIKAHIVVFQLVVKNNCMLKLNSPFGMAGEPVAQDGHSVDGTTAIEMDLQFICCSSIIYLWFVQQCVRSEMWKKHA